ncbi:unnamed protein product [Lepeophtheirus salmonis]|uniref:(salmon louse) hypothetical protein n=1 Tax=Lepeophtheirus salmonis TaxID=72036 RepID=A0A7R8CNJ9_LEPSM|nr:unnamed protein product [Lepeophtheirus salmonis]CAF2873186.1 unnamed protein product [Lepeophtheirus salmonis]
MLQNPLPTIVASLLLFPLFVESYLLSRLWRNNPGLEAECDGDCRYSMSCLPMELVLVTGTNNEYGNGIGVHDDPPDIPFGPVVNDPSCGVPTISSRRIVGGSEAGFGNFPWQALIRIGTSRCGGALISPYYVVTAGHCINSAKASSIRVYLGEYTLYRRIEPLPREKYGVSEIELHPYYRFTPQADRYDVALLRLNTRNEVYKEGTIGTVAGWGALSPTSTIRPNKLQAVDKGIHVRIFSDMFCAGYKEGKRDACQGDSGGPLVVKDIRKGRWVLIGLVSAGYSCAKAGQPGIYHQISKTLPLIFALILVSSLKFTTTSFLDDPELSSHCRSQGGTCGPMLSCLLKMGFVAGSCGGVFSVCCAQPSTVSRWIRENNHGSNHIGGGDSSSQYRSNHKKIKFLGSRYGPVVNDPHCGRPVELTANRRVLDGKPAGFGSFPWQALIRIGKGKNVGGVTRAVVHPRFQFSPAADRYDVAVLTIDRPVQYAPHIAPICLPEAGRDPAPGTNAYVAGWGALIPDDVAGPLIPFLLPEIKRPSVLQVVNVPVLDNERCETWHKDKGFNIKIWPEMGVCWISAGGKGFLQRRLRWTFNGTTKRWSMGTRWDRISWVFLWKARTTWYLSSHIFYLRLGDILC